MAVKSKSWKAEADGIRWRAQERPEWMVSPDELEDYLAEVRAPRVILGGSRDWDDRSSIDGALRKALDFLEGDTKRGVYLVHGVSRGASELGARRASALDFIVEPHRPERNIHSRSCPEENPGTGACWQHRPQGCRKASQRLNRRLIESGADILLLFIRDGSSDAQALLDLWLQEDRPTIICRQDGDGPVRAELLHMASFR